ncbi:MAG: hypothetical protein ACJAZC_000321 [Cryomorphaceae bacterium]|jgi:hypothetical protein
MNHELKSSALFALLLFLPSLLFSQTIGLCSLSSFEAYTGSGAVTNSGIFTGDVGTNSGVLTGFDDPDFSGSVYNNDAVTSEARIDLLRLYIQLSNIFVTHPGTHAAAFGSGETIKAGTYSVIGAGSLGGMLTLDGEGDADAVFVIKFKGAFTIGASSTIILSNGTRACNVFWIAEGAIAVAAGSDVKGTLLSHQGAVSLAANCNIEGRLLATEGAITVGAGNTASAPMGPISIPTSCSANCTPASAVNVLGSVGDFTLFTSLGAVSNAASSGFIGDVGTHAGAITGMATSVHVGASHTANTTTEKAKIDLVSAYDKLILIPNTHTSHPPSFGGGETLFAGVYSIGGAGSLAGTITLDGQNNPDAVFIFKFNGAFTTAAHSKVIFTNGTLRCNVFWISEGATDMGTFTFMKGTVLAHGGACTMASNGILEGRMLSTGGAVGFSTGTAYNDPVCCLGSLLPLPIELLSFTAEAQDASVQFNWATATESNNDYFDIERSTDGIYFNSIRNIDGAGNSTQTIHYSTFDRWPLPGVNYYRLKQTDFNGATSYSNIKAVEFSDKNNFDLDIFPNPSSGETTFYSAESFKNANLIVYNSSGQAVKFAENIFGMTFTLNCENLSSGLYFVKLLQDGIVVATDKLVLQ